MGGLRQAMGDAGGAALEFYTATVPWEVRNAVLAEAARLGIPAGQLNDFRHLAGSCLLARSLGEREASSALFAHEVRLNEDAEDTDIDMRNNSIGLSFGVDPANSRLGCSDWAAGTLGP